MHGYAAKITCHITLTMDIQCTWIYEHGKICRQFRLLLWGTSFIGHLVYSVGWEGKGWGLPLF